MTKPHTSPVYHSGIEAMSELGQELRSLREQKGLTMSDVAERLKLPVRQIEALENGLYENLPEPVFIRGFLRSYGRFLDMDEAELSRRLEWITPNEMYRHDFNSTNLNYTNTRIKKGFPKWIWVLILLAGVGAAVYFWQEKSNSENAKQESLSTLDNGQNETAASNLSASNIIVKPMTASDTGTKMASSAVETINNGELVIRTRYRSVLKVTNAQGKELSNKIVAPGEYRFNEGAPFSVHLGYVKGAIVLFNGQEMDLKKYIDGKSASFNTDGDLAASASATGK